MPVPKRKSTPVSESTNLSEVNRVISEKLTQKYDVLNDLFSHAEARIKSLKPLSAVWVAYNADEDGCYELIGITKVDGKWRLVHAIDHDTNYDSLPSDIKPIVECNVENRIGAVDHIEQLYKRIVDRKEAFLPQVEQAIAKLTKFCTEE